MVSNLFFPLQVKNELPSTFKAFRYQQHRWSCGPANLFRKMSMEIIRNKVSFILSYYHLSEPWSSRKDSMEFSFGRLVFEESTRILHVSDFYKFKVLEFQYFKYFM